MTRKLHVSLLLFLCLAFLCTAQTAVPTTFAKCAVANPNVAVYFNCNPLYLPQNYEDFAISVDTLIYQAQVPNMPNPCEILRVLFNAQPLEFMFTLRVDMNKQQPGQPPVKCVFVSRFNNPIEPQDFLDALENFTLSHGVVINEINAHSFSMLIQLGYSHKQEMRLEFLDNGSVIAFGTPEAMAEILDKNAKPFAFEAAADNPASPFQFQIAVTPAQQLILGAFVAKLPPVLRQIALSNRLSINVSYDLPMLTLFTQCAFATPERAAEFAETAKQLPKFVEDMLGKDSLNARYYSSFTCAAEGKVVKMSLKAPAMSFSLNSIAGFFATNFRHFFRARQRAQEIECINNMKQLALAVTMFENDHKSVFPAENSWKQDIAGYIAANIACRQHPELGLDSYVYMLNGQKSDSVSDPAKTIMFYEKIDNHPENPNVTVAFVDGHVAIFNRNGHTIEEIAKNYNLVILK